MNVKSILQVCFLFIAVLLGATPLLAEQAEEVVVIGHPGLPKADRAQLLRLYTGRSIEMNGQVVTVANAAPGSATRQQFLLRVVHMDEARYRAYWTVRRHVGKGVPPTEVSPDEEMIQFVNSTPGAIGYIGASAVSGELNVIARY